VSRFHRFLLVVIVGAISTSVHAQSLDTSDPIFGRLLAQNPPPNSGDAERLRVELAERARQEEEQKSWETKIFQIKYVDPNELWQALKMFRGNMTVSGGGLRVLSVRAPKEIMPAIEDAIKRLDVPTPRREAELTAYVLMASDQPQADTGTIPATLQPVVTELKKVLAYKGFQLVDTLIARGGEGREINLQGALPSIIGASSERTSYSLIGRLTVQTDGKGSVLRISGMRFNLNSASGFPGQGGVTIATDVEVPQGQQVVVGKATFVDRAFILVMTAKFPN
jgi:hypothetical protein